MVDRMLVRVGFHKKEGLKVLNEKTLVSVLSDRSNSAHHQRRDPTDRLDHFEEYVAVWRKDFVQLYQDYVSSVNSGNAKLTDRKHRSKDASQVTSSYAGRYH